ncbi:hypothetical protein BwSF19_77260 [Bradyrhizobium ottawaense]|nr:hypothetical protein BwSF19_77260 [Bradyrhizobium ottawaense]
MVGVISVNGTRQSRGESYEAALRSATPLASSGTSFSQLKRDKIGTNHHRA